MLQEELEETLSAEERRDVRAFLATEAGTKVLQTLDTFAENKNNLLQAVNAMAEAGDTHKIGLKCSILAAEVRVALELSEFLTAIGEKHVS